MVKINQPQEERDATDARDTSQSQRSLSSAQTNHEKSPNSLGTAPVYKDRLGRIQMAVWAREDRQKQLRYTITLKRTYKVQEGYRETNSLDQRDLADAVHLLRQAQEFLPELSVETSSVEADIQSSTGANAAESIAVQKVF